MTQIATSKVSEIGWIRWQCHRSLWGYTQLSDSHVLHVGCAGKIEKITQAFLQEPYLQD